MLQTASQKKQITQMQKPIVAARLVPIALAVVAKSKLSLL
jgi:hypothetical protein